MGRLFLISLLLVYIMFSSGCRKAATENYPMAESTETRIDSSTSFLPETIVEEQLLKASDIQLEPSLLYDRHTLSDEYPYSDTVRRFQWETIRKCLAFIENMQCDSVRWAVLKNYKNMNKEAPLVGKYVRNVYGRLADTLGVERYQSVPLFSQSDSIVPVRYGRDGSLAWFRGQEGGFHKIELVTIDGEWLVPLRYIKILPDSTVFHHVAFVDRQNQNIAVVERLARGEWAIRSMNPATTGVHRPPYAQETPLGMFLLQEKKRRMTFLKDGGTATAGYAPYASRFTNGAYIHGVPVNLPATSEIEYSWSLGTTPRSHMCVRNATSHAKFVYEYLPTEMALVVVIE